MSHIIAIPKQCTKKQEHKKSHLMHIISQFRQRIYKIISKLVKKYSIGTILNLTIIYVTQTW